MTQPLHPSQVRTDAVAGPSPGRDLPVNDPPPADGSQVPIQDPPAQNPEPNAAAKTAERPLASGTATAEAAEAMDSEWPDDPNPEAHESAV